MTSPIRPTASAGPGPTRAAAPDDPAEAARQFEAVLVRQFVDVMTKDLFQSDGEGMLTGQADLQRDTLTDTLTDHLVDSGTFGIADLLMGQWERAGRIPTDAEADTPGPVSRPPLSTSDALRMTSPAQARPLSIDPSEDRP